MSAILSSVTDCCESCDTTVNVAVPGPKGDAGSNGSDGSNGVSAYSTTTAAFTMPAESADVAVEVDSSLWMAPNQKVYVQNAGYMEVRSKSDSTHVTLRNIENTASGHYTENVAPSTIVALGQQISPAGIIGPDGADGTSGAPDSASYWTRTSEAGLSAESAIDGLSDGIIQHSSGTPSIADLVTAIEALAANGLIVRTSATTASARTVTGTASEITVTNGDGVSGNPTLSLHSGVYRAGGTDVALADGGTGASTAPAARANLNVLSGYGLLGSSTSVDLNQAATDVATVAMLSSSYIVERVVATNASVSLTTATAGVFNAAGGSGTICADQAMSALTASGKYLEMTISGVGSTDVQTSATLRIRCGTPQGAAATADFYIFGYKLD